MNLDDPMTKPCIAHIHEDIGGAALALGHLNVTRQVGVAYSSCTASGLRSALGPSSMIDPLGIPTSSNGVGNIFSYPLPSCIFPICKRQSIKKYIVSVFLPSWWTDAYEVSIHDTDHLTHLKHPARTIWNTVPPRARLFAIHHAFFCSRR